MNELLTSGIELMLIGMGIVYAFLAMLIVAVNLMSTLVRRYFPEMPPKFDPPIVVGADKAVVAAITAAVHQYRKKHNA